MALLTSATKAPRLFKSAIKTLGFGFWTGRGIGGTKTQATNRTTGVSFDTSTNRGKLSGQITCSGAGTIAASGVATFTVTNKAVGAKDVIHVAIASGWATATVVPYVSAVAEGSFNISLANVHTATANSDTLVLNFWVFKAVTN
jgi:hypothetical protein